MLTCSQYNYYSLFSFIVGRMAVPCCFCMMEFPVWNGAVTSHIASHVKIKSIRCVACCLSFASKESLMNHLHSSHSRLPEGICIDVGIENHERRRLQCKTDTSPGINEAALSGEVLCTEKQQDSSEKSHVDFSGVTSVNSVGTSKPQMSESDRCSSVSSVDGIESVSSISMGDIPLSHANNNIAKDSTAGSSASKTCRRKLRKPSQVLVNNPIGVGTETVRWVEITAAMQPMVAQCSDCTFTCNTELQLKV